MAKKVFVFLTFVALILLAAMAFSKPEPWEHQAAVRQLAMNVVSQEVSNAQLPDELVAAGAADELEHRIDQCCRFFPAE